MKCDSCVNWLTKRKTVYSDGSEVVTFEVPNGYGHCLVLNIDTAPDFGCLSFKEGQHVSITHKDGLPWQHWHYDTCPECRGRGSQPPPNEKHCNRCFGTGRVRYYDDGYVGDEKTKAHPKEKESVCVETVGTMLKPIVSPKEGLM